MPIFHDVAEYVQEDVPHPPFFIDNLLPRGGELLLYGEAGEMKSFLAMHMGFCISTSTPWLDFTTTEAKCLLCNFEINTGEYHRRLVHVNRNFTLDRYKLYVTSPGIKLLDQPGDLAWFKRELIEPIDPDVVILDCFAKCFGGDENSNQEVGRFFANMKEIEEDRRGIVIVHHSNRNILQNDAMNRYRGASRLAGDPDTVIRLVRQPVGKQLHFGKARLTTVELRAKNIIFDNYIWRTR